MADRRLRHDLDGNYSVQAQVLCPVHRTHAASSDEVIQPIAALDRAFYRNNQFQFSTVLATCFGVATIAKAANRTLSQQAFEVLLNMTKSMQRIAHPIEVSSQFREFITAKRRHTMPKLPHRNGSNSLCEPVYRSTDRPHD